MSGNEPQMDEIEQQLEEIGDRANDLMNQGHFRTAARLNGERARTAKQNNKLMQYIYGTFFRMDQAQNVLDFDVQRDCAIELVAVLEDEDQARAIQADFLQPEYEHTRFWMTACVYENLAEAIGQLDGYNSEGMHQCISEGILVCRQTGKMQCVSCFREYATDVYTSADDPLIARHQCQTVLGQDGGWSNRGDRRWFAATKLARSYMLESNFEAALEAMNQAASLVEAEEISLKFESRMRMLANLDMVRIAAGMERIDWTDDEGPGEDRPPVGEWTVLDLQISMNDALLASMQGNYEDAIAILTDHDRALSKQKVLNIWFDVRLRLIAAMRLSGDARVEKLAQQLRDKANGANDFLTLRRLDRLFDDSIPVSPFAAVSSGEETDAPLPFQVSRESEKSDAFSETQGQGQAAAMQEEGPSDFDQEVLAFIGSCYEIEDEDERMNAMTEFAVRYNAETVTNDRNVMSLMGFRQMVPFKESVQEIWDWARAFERAMPDEPSVLSMIATLGLALKVNFEGEAEGVIADEELGKMFKLSLLMDANRPGNHLRAGEYFLEIGNEGEAERCFARSFRLDRSNPSACENLANVYRQTDRPRDALNVLDVYLRDGGEYPGIAWMAANVALDLEQFDSVLTYLDRLDMLEPGTMWSNYYRALALIELECYDAAADAIAAEREFEDHESPAPMDMLEAAQLLGSGSDSGLEALQKINEIRFSEVTDMTATGIQNLSGLVWRQMGNIPPNNVERQKFESTLLKAGIMPDGYFDILRDGEPDPDVLVNYYRMLVAQPLDESWGNSPGCLAGEEEWSAYCIEWGVLAPDEDEAVAQVLELQRECFDLEPEVIGVELEAEGFQDCAGIVWQGRRFPVSRSEEGDEDEE
ncbi:MAG: hypothetical protein CMJ78_16095 [Planctomycetaceae bacterium]|nr:hypothetical protein [Planctomycetaceae bacterium]